MRSEMRRLAALAVVSLVLAGPAGAVSRYALEQADWEVANAQATAPVHVQVKLDGVDLNDRGYGGPQACTLRGTVERSFRGGLAVGRPVVLRESCIVRASGPIGVIEYGFDYRRLLESGHMELFLSADGARILGHAGWIIKDASDVPQHPAPATMPPPPSTGDLAKVGTIKGGTQLALPAKPKLATQPNVNIPVAKPPPAAASACAYPVTVACAVSAIEADIQAAPYVRSEVLIDLAHAQAALGRAEAARATLAAAVGQARRGGSDNGLILESLVGIAAAQYALGDGDGLRATAELGRGMLAAKPEERRGSDEVAATAALDSWADLPEAAQEVDAAIARLRDDTDRKNRPGSVKRGIAMLVAALSAKAPGRLPELAKLSKLFADSPDFIGKVMAHDWADADAQRDVLRAALAAVPAGNPTYLLGAVERLLGRDAAIERLTRQPEGDSKGKSPDQETGDWLTRADTLVRLNDPDGAGRALSQARTALADVPPGSPNAGSLARHIAISEFLLNGDEGAARTAAGNDVWPLVVHLARAGHSDAVQELLPKVPPPLSPTFAGIEARVLLDAGEAQGAWTMASRIDHDDTRRAAMAQAARALAKGK